MLLSTNLTSAGPLAWLLNAWQLPGELPSKSLLGEKSKADTSQGILVLRTALALWMVLLIGTCVKNYVSPVKKTVYPYFSHAAQHWWANQNLYADYPGFDPYRYSPTFAVALTPLGLIPDQWGGIIWAILSITLLLASFRRLVAEILPGEWSAEREGYFLMLAWASSLGGIWSQQSNSLILALVIFGLVNLQRQRFWQAAMLLALPVYIKLWPLAIVLLLVVRWQWNLMPRFLVCLAILAFVPYLTKPWPYVNEQYSLWYQALTGPLQGRWAGYRDAWTLWETFAGPVDVRGYKFLQLGTAAALFLWCCWQSRLIKSDRGLLLAILGSWACWQLLFGPGSERLTQGLIAPGLAWACLEARRLGRASWLMAAAWLMQVLFAMGSIEIKLAKVFPYAQVLLPLAVLTCLLWILVYPFAAATEFQTETAEAVA